MTRAKGEKDDGLALGVSEDSSVSNCIGFCALGILARDMPLSISALAHVHMRLVRAARDAA